MTVMPTSASHPGGRPGRRPGRAGWLAAAASLGAGAAWAQLGGGYSSLPATVTDTRVGDLRGQLQQYLPGLLPRGPGPAFLGSASLGVDAAQSARSPPRRA